MFKIFGTCSEISFSGFVVSTLGIDVEVTMCIIEVIYVVKKMYFIVEI